MGFSVGDRVHLPGIGSGVVREARGGDRYAVEIKGRVVIASGRDLQPADPRRRARRTTAAVERQPDAPAAAPRSLDLHGKTVEEAVALVDAFVNDALLAGLAEVYIVHGRGTGKVQSAVHASLGRIAAVATVRLDPSNPGVTIVTFA